MTMIHNRHPQVNLVIAGKGEWYFDISKYENLPYITLRNEYIAISDLASLLQGALFAVCPYKDATQSGVVQTAFSANLPLIVTNVGALPAAVKDDVYGRVVPPCDSASLADAMDDLLTNMNKLERYRDNIDRLWHPAMEWGSIADIYIRTWREV
jgi:glycosyltransferase involved in cell wall biosynthesis